MVLECGPGAQPDLHFEGGNELSFDDVIVHVQP